MHNADRYGLNAHEEIPDLQDLYTIPYNINDEKIANVKIHGKYKENIAKIKKEKEEAQNRVKRNYRLGGTVIGGGIGYKIGSHFAKKTPVISQQRKRKLLGTVIGATGGLAVGEGLSRLHNKKLTDPKFQKKFEDNEKWKDEAWKMVHRKFLRRKGKTPIYRADPSPRPESDYSDLGNYSPVYRHSNAQPAANRIIEWLKSHNKI